jgi:hypothetical protein
VGVRGRRLDEFFQTGGPRNPAAYTHVAERPPSNRAERAILASPLRRLLGSSRSDFEKVQTVPTLTRKVRTPLKERALQDVARRAAGLSIYRLRGVKEGVERLQRRSEERLRKVTRRLVDAIAAPRIPKAAYAKGGEFSQATRAVIRKSKAATPGAFVRMRDDLVTLREEAAGLPRGFTRRILGERGASTQSRNMARAIMKDANLGVRQSIEKGARARLSRKYPSIAERAGRMVAAPLRTSPRGLIEKLAARRPGLVPARIRKMARKRTTALVPRTARRLGLNVPTEVRRGRYVTKGSRKKFVASSENTIQVRPRIEEGRRVSGATYVQKSRRRRRGRQT